MKPWLIWLVLFCVAETAMLANNAALDTLAWRSTRWFVGDQDAYKWGEYKAGHASDSEAPFYMRDDPPLTRRDSNGWLEARFYKRTQQFWRLFRDLGEPLLTVILVLVVALYDRRRWRAGAMLTAAAVLAGAAGMLVRMTTGRLRPDGILLDDALRPVRTFAGEFVRNDGGNHWYWFRGFSFSASDLAFPSGHATLAFATAAVLAYLSPRGRVLFFSLAALCALTRVVMQAHFYSDAILGAALGLAIGHAVAIAMDRWTERPVTPAV